MLELWPNWFQPPSRTADPGITHLSWAKGSHHPKRAGTSTQERGGCLGEAACPFPWCLGADAGACCLPVLSLLTCTISHPILSPSL